jgi:hypothetical protein
MFVQPKNSGRNGYGVERIVRYARHQGHPPQDFEL